MHTGTTVPSLELIIIWSPQPVVHCSSHWPELSPSDKGPSNSRTWARPSIDTFSISHPACTLVVLWLVNQSLKVALLCLLTRARLMGTLKHSHRVDGNFLLLKKCQNWIDDEVYVRKVPIEGSSILIEWMPISLSLPLDRLYWISSVCLLTASPLSVC